MKMLRNLAALALAFLIAVPHQFARAGAGNNVADSGGRLGAATADSVPPGTVITIQNWQNYRQFMPDGMAAMFEGKYYWKMPADVQMAVATNVTDPLPKNYLAATEKYADQIKVVELPDGGLSLQDYHGGIPFPNPQEPHKGWKVLMNLWYRYAPHLLVDTHGWDCAVDGSGNSNCESYQLVDRQLGYNTDAGIVADTGAPGAKYFTEWFMLLEPEQSRYTTQLTINYVDLAKPEEVYTFLPSLRRSQPMATSGRCAAYGGEDWTAEDFRSGFDSNVTEIESTYLGHKRILALTDIRAPEDPFPGEFYLPLIWPKPGWAKWQVREVNVISVKKIPSRAAGYCYGNRVIYADQHFFAPLWEDLYDSQMRPWKFTTIIPQQVEVPGIGPVNTPGVDVELIWDVRRNHASASGESARAVYVNEQAPAEFQDLARYTTPAGLNLIMR